MDDGAFPVTEPLVVGNGMAGSAVESVAMSDPSVQSPYVTIVLPCYNEQGHVATEVERICAAMDSRIGTQQARGDIVVWTDADMSYPNERIPELVQTLEKDHLLDQVVGARTSEQGTHKMFRVPAKWFIRKIAEMLTNSSIPDLNSGLRAFRRQVALPYLRLLPPGFSCVTTITLAFLCNQHDVRYVPIDYAKRSGTSKFKFFKDAYRYILQVLRMVMYFNPLKVLMPVALFLIGLGVAKGIFDMVVHPLLFAVNTVLIFVSGLIIASMALLADLIVRSRDDS
jgi:glycosyltransferase involved in cell wall biosynthesis